MYILLMRILNDWFGKYCDELWMLAHMLCNPLEVVEIVIHFVVQNDDKCMVIRMMRYICIYEECEENICV